MKCLFLWQRYILLFVVLFKLLLSDLQSGTIHNWTVPSNEYLVQHSLPLVLVNVLGSKHKALRSQVAGEFLCPYSIIMKTPVGQCGRRQVFYQLAENHPHSLFPKANPDFSMHKRCLCWGNYYLINCHW